MYPKVPCQSNFVDQAQEDAYAHELHEEAADKEYYRMKMPEAYDILSKHFHEDGGDDIILGLAHWITCHGDTKVASLNELADKVKEAIFPALMKKVDDASKDFY
jgi:hypothetical protein